MRSDQGAYLDRFIHEVSSGDARRVWERYVGLMAGTSQVVEISTDSAQAARCSYLRLALTRLDWRQVLALFAAARYSQQQVSRLMLANTRDHCFGIGLADYRSARRESRVKLYNFYHRSTVPVDISGHLKRTVDEIGSDWQPVKEDLRLFRKVRVSAVDFYRDGERDLKVYYGPFLTRDIWGRFREIFPREARSRYRELAAAGALPPLVLFCVRNGSSGRSVRTDFWYMTRHIPVYLRLVDNGTASRLYRNLGLIKQRAILTFVGMDLGLRPRTHFYFELNAWLAPEGSGARDFRY